jgi:general secretion pathway protein K
MNLPRWQGMALPHDRKPMTSKPSGAGPCPAECIFQQAPRNPPAKGGALLAVLWFSAALAAIAFSVAASVRAETDRASTSAEGLRAYYLATGAVDRAIQWMMWGPSFRNPDGSARFWQPNLPRMYMSFPSGDAVVELTPESAKLNINTASPDDLLRVVAIVTGDAVTGNLERSREIVAAILDWRSPAAQASSFDQFYFSIAPTFRARHASFEEIEELLLVRGMTPEVFYGNYIPNPNGDPDGPLVPTGGLRDCLSVWGSAGPFDVNTASPALIEAMGVPRQGVDAIVAHRAVRPFLNMGEVAALGFPTSRLTLGGNWIWTLRASARLRRPDGAPSEFVRTAAAVVKLVDRERFFIAPVHVLRWYDDAWSQTALVPPAFSSGAPPATSTGAPLP